MATILQPGYLRWDGFKYVLDPTVEIIGPPGPPGPSIPGPQGIPGSAGATGPAGPDIPAVPGDISGTLPTLTVVQVTGSGTNDYGGPGTKVYVAATETKMGLALNADTGLAPFQPRVDGFINQIVTPNNTPVTIATIGVDPGDAHHNLSSCADLVVTILGMDATLNGVFWRGDLLFTSYWANGIITLYNQSGAAVTINPVNVRSDGGVESSSMTATATASGSLIVVQVTGASGNINWNCIAQIQWMN